ANTGRSREAESVFREMIPLEARVLGETNPAHASTLYTLADLLRHRGAHREAADLYERAGAIRAGALGPEHPSVLRAMHRQGAALHAAGDGEAGRARLAEAVGVCRRTGDCAQAGNRDADFLAALLADYGRALADVGREAEARRALTKAADLHRQRGETEDEARLRAALQEI
ncbi:MAG TPA: tetratricopeptide repeat protein, partial [Rhodothermales bacterium]|nr:tetratricopeptide repeat protein [Rhodothermales bacterium]